jgi:hypothetical protein
VCLKLKPFEMYLKPKLTVIKLFLDWSQAGLCILYASDGMYTNPLDMRKTTMCIWNILIFNWKIIYI